MEGNKPHQSKKGPSVKQQILDSIEEMLSKLINRSVPEKEGKYESGTLWLTRSDVRRGSPPGKFHIFYVPSKWELNRGLFTKVRFPIAVGNYVRKSVWFDLSPSLATVRASIREILFSIGFSEEIMPFY